LYLFPADFRPDWLREVDGDDLLHNPDREADEGEQSHAVQQDPEVKRQC